MINLIFMFSLLFLFSCDDDPVSANDSSSPKLYVCDQGSDRVVVLDASTDELTQINSISIDFSNVEMDDMSMEIPHFVAIDEPNGY